jgi:glutathione S-transferase
MITVFGEGRGFRVVWLLEEMGLAYQLRPVDLLAGVEKDAEFLAINPAGFIPAIQDDDVTMVESIAIMEYLMARYGPTPLAPDPHDPAFPAYQHSFSTSAKPASQPPSTSSLARAILRQSPSGRTGVPARR